MRFETSDWILLGILGLGLSGIFFWVAVLVHVIGWVFK
jgi:hypothetical protein